MKKYIKENKFYLLTILIVILLFNIRLPYYINTPGGTININDRIEYKNLKKYDGSLNMLYVTEYVATIPTYLMSYIIKEWDVEEISANQISDETPEEIDTRNKIMLDNSIHNAIYVAYNAANCKIEIKNKRNLVIGTTTKNGLEIGDELLELEGEPIENVEMIKQTISQKEIGDNLTFLLKRDGKEQEVTVKIQEIEETKGIGVVIITDYDYEIDPQIELKFKKSESGSSGGLMMALSIYSAISEKDILKGRNIAGTGTIDMNGNVGKIDGIKYKIMGAVKDNMDIVLVPSDNYQEAKKIVKEKNYDIEIVEVKTFEDAINYLEK
ncbi:MAG: PDZ domain-containing protein [Erysipelotrichaceae bacterium]|nr:PDZ domain-containing protein [Erysipelotrichaceae bacterium]